MVQSSLLSALVLGAALLSKGERYTVISHGDFLTVIQRAPLSAVLLVKVVRPSRMKRAVCSSLVCVFISTLPRH